MTPLAPIATRAQLLARLHRRSDDFAATTALKALDSFAAEDRADHPSGAPERLQREGQSGIRRALRWLHISGAT